MARTRLLPDPASAGAARRFVADVLLNRCFSDGCIERAMVVTSEVVTEAVEQADSDLELVVAAEYPMVRVEVRDCASADQPLASRPPCARRLVGALSEAWGVDEVSAGGRSIWFEMRS